MAFSHSIVFSLLLAFFCVSHAKSSGPVIPGDMVPGECPCIVVTKKEAMMSCPIGCDVFKTKFRGSKGSKGYMCCKLPEEKSSDRQIKAVDEDMGLDEVEERQMMKTSDRRRGRTVIIARCVLRTCVSSGSVTVCRYQSGTCIIVV